MNAKNDTKKAKTSPTKKGGAAKGAVPSPPTVATPVEGLLGMDRYVTSHEAGELLQVNPSSINKWGAEGRLKFYKTPGGHRRILIRDLVAFLREYAMPIPSAIDLGDE